MKLISAIFLFYFILNPVLAQVFTPNDGNWASKDTSIADTPEGDLMVRTGDIDNMGFGWPSGFDPFSGFNTPSHSFPWTVDTTDPGGTDRIMVVSSYVGTPPSGRDGYTNSTSRPGNAVDGVVLNFTFQGQIEAAYLYAFLDDFQAPVWHANYQVMLDSIRVPFYEGLVNSLVQTGPIGKIVKLPIPSSLLYLLNDGKLELKFDDVSTGAGDGFSIDFVKLVINPVILEGSCLVKGTVTELSSGLPIAGVRVMVNGLDSAFTDAAGKYRIPAIHPGILFVQTYKQGFGAETATLILSQADSAIRDFALKTGAPQLVYHFPEDNAVSMDTSVHLKMVFSRSMNLQSFSALTFILSDGEKNVGGTYSASGDTLIFSPDTLLWGKTYLATAIIGLRSTDNISLDRNYSFSFSTFDPSSSRKLMLPSSLMAAYLPSRGLFQVSGITAGCLLSVYDSEGKLVLQESNASAEHLLDLSCHSPGIYILRAQKENSCSQIRLMLRP
jgi:hypothetical protein